MPALVNLTRLAEVASEQWGLITRAQAEDAGVPPTTLERLTSDGVSLQRVAHGVYLLGGSAIPDHLELRAAWLQLAPRIPVWERTAAEGVVSHRSAASLYDLGHLTADRHEFTVAHRRQSRRKDVAIHIRHLPDQDWITMGSMPVTRPARIVSDLIYEHEDPEAVAQILSVALVRTQEYARTFAFALMPHARRLGFRTGSGVDALRWLVDLAGDTRAKAIVEDAVEDSRKRDQPLPGSP